MAVDINNRIGYQQPSFRGEESQKGGSNPFLPALGTGVLAGGGAYYGLTTPHTEDTFVKRVQDGSLNTKGLTDAQKTQVETLKSELNKTPAATETVASTAVTNTDELVTLETNAKKAARKFNQAKEIADLQLEQTNKMQEIYDKTLTQVTQKPLASGETVETLTAEQTKINKGMAHQATIIADDSASPSVKTAAEEELKKLKAELESIEEKILPDSDLAKKHKEGLIAEAKSDQTKLVDEQKKLATALDEAKATGIKAKEALTKLQDELAKETDAAKKMELQTKVASAKQEFTKATEVAEEISHKHSLAGIQVKNANDIVDGLGDGSLKTKLTVQKLVANVDEKNVKIGTAFANVADESALGKAFNKAVEEYHSATNTSAEAVAKKAGLMDLRNKFLGVTENAKTTTASVVENLPARVKALVTETFNAVKENLPKEKSAGKAGLIALGAAVVTYIGLKMFGGSDKGEA